MLLLGIDIGSSSVKASVLDGETGTCVASAYMPVREMEILAMKTGWAEQDPQLWWDNLKAALKLCTKKLGKKMVGISAIGISYQMHGLVTVGKDLIPLRPAIIWCDSRAVEYGSRAFNDLGKEFCLSRLLNSPSNFTASKLAWVKENEPGIFRSIYRIMLPGDYIGMKMTGEVLTTFSGLSEGIFWDFLNDGLSQELLNYFGFNLDLVPPPVPCFSIQGKLIGKSASELGLPEGIPVSYRAGDQPNNALSLCVLSPGEVAATAGTSGVIYGVTDQKKSDPYSRVNTFLHVNHSPGAPRMGILLCINGAGILNSWIRKISGGSFSYEEMNSKASEIKPGSDGLFIYPFGNGAERMLKNVDPGAVISGLNFNVHSYGHLFRAVQEGIAFSFRYGLDIMKETGLVPGILRAGDANMFRSCIFREALAGVTGISIDLYNTDGSLGAARGAGIGCGYYDDEKDAFIGLKNVGRTEPDRLKVEVYEDVYSKWKRFLENSLDKIPSSRPSPGGEIKGGIFNRE